MRRLLVTLSLLCALIVVAPAPGAPVESAAAKARSAKKKPLVRLVAPMRVTVGRRVVIRGGRFSRSRRRNTIIFRAPDRRVAFAKPVRAFPRKLVVRVPASVERLLRKEEGDASKGLPTRLQLRVITRRRFGRLTRIRRSPLVVSALRTGAPAACGTGDDFDNDFIPNDREAQLKTDPCRADTDGDGVEDGFEMESALDLNQRALPYPGKRPFPNALDPSDAGNDNDGDGLTLAEEFRAWAQPASPPFGGALQTYIDSDKGPGFGGPYGGSPAFGNHSLPMNYSDGSQATGGGVPDDRRDADGDGLSNFDEIRGLAAQGTYSTGPAAECYEYKPLLPRNFAGVDYLDRDTDGDGILDGNDDQDNDGVSNVDEIAQELEPCGDSPRLPIYTTASGDQYRLNLYNPCLPDPGSSTCARSAPE